MGCACSKGEVEQESPTTNYVPHQSLKRSIGSARVVTADFFNDTREKDRVNEQTFRVVGKQNGVAPVTFTKEEANDKRNEKAWAYTEPKLKLSNPPKYLEAEQVAAGWPAWLSAVAGEAIKGWIPRRADSFEKLDKIGQGTYSNVYKARDLDKGKIVALKKVRFHNLDPESVRFMAREILVLRRLDHPNVINLEGLVTSRMSCSLYLVFEYMEHDLAGLAACPGIHFTETQVKCYLLQLLRGLEHCHGRNVLHRDIKGSNLLLDNKGVLKIADFGLATIYHESQKQPLTSRVVTLWYRAPELLLGATEYGIGIDLWSTGCILAELLAGKPIMPGRTEVEQLHKIFKLCGSPSEEYWRKSKLPHATIFKPKQPYKRCLSETFSGFPLSSLDLLETLLAIEPTERETAAAALSSHFFTTKPLACDPWSLPKYPPSKELDARIRDEETRRRRATGGKTHVSEVASSKGTRERSSKAVPVPNANAEFSMSLQKRKMHSHSVNSKSEKFAPPNEDTAIGFPIDPPRPTHLPMDVRAESPASAHPALKYPSSLSGPLGGPGLKLLKEREIRLAPSRTSNRPTNSVRRPNVQSQDLSNFSSLVAATHIGKGHDAAEEVRHRTENYVSQWDSDAVVKKDNAEYSTKADGKYMQQRDAFKEEKRTKLLKATTTGAYQLDHENAELQQELRASKAKQGLQSQTRISHSGPLIGPGGRGAANMEELLEGHERRMQQAARRAIQEAGKNIRYSHAPAAKPGAY